jgi:hypothetical protein
VNEYDFLRPDIDLAHLRRQLSDFFNLEELRTLCFDMSIKYEDLPGDTITAKARELVIFCYRYGRIPQLLDICKQQRQDVKWDHPAQATVSDQLPDAWIDPLQSFYRLVKAFNRNRGRPFSDQRTLEGDNIAFAMREAAPFLFDRFDVANWLDSGSAGKRLAAIKYLDWLEDIDFMDNLMAKLATERPFMQLHALIALDSMVDQLDEGRRKKLRLALNAYRIERLDSDRDFWRRRILARLGDNT